MKKLKTNVFFLFVVFTAAIFIPFGLLSLTIGPTRWIADYAIKANYPQNTESNLQILIIALLLLISISFGYKLTLIYRKKSVFSKKIILITAFIIIFCCLSIFTFKPEILMVSKLNLAQVKSQTTIFEFGNYPDEDKIFELKKNGFTGIISLLHPMVIPAEPVMLSKEKITAAQVGIPIIRIPMLPWISKNEESIQKIRKLAHTAKGKYYVHCSLGRDRAGLFKKIIESENAKITINSVIKHNIINIQKPFERGNIFILSKNIYFTPYPTDEELFHYFLNSNIKTVVNLMNGEDLEQKKWIDKQKIIIENHHQTFYNFPITFKTSDEKINEIIKIINQLPKPIVIHDFKSDSKVSKRFLKLYNKK